MRKWQLVAHLLGHGDVIAVLRVIATFLLLVFLLLSFSLLLSVRLLPLALLPLFFFFFFFFFDSTSASPAPTSGATSPNAILAASGWTAALDILRPSRSTNRVLAILRFERLQLSHTRTSVHRHALLDLRNPLLPPRRLPLLLPPCLLVDIVVPAQDDVSICNTNPSSHEFSRKADDEKHETASDKTACSATEKYSRHY